MAAVFCADLRRSAMRRRMRVILTRDSVLSPFAAGMMGGRATCQYFGPQTITEKKSPTDSFSLKMPLYYFEVYVETLSWAPEM